MYLASHGGWSDEAERKRTNDTILAFDNPKSIDKLSNLKCGLLLVKIHRYHIEDSSLIHPIADEWIIKDTENPLFILYELTL